MPIPSLANALAPIPYGFILYPHMCLENVYERAGHSVYLYTCTCLYKCTLPNSWTSTSAYIYIYIYIIYILVYECLGMHALLVWLPGAMVTGRGGSLPTVRRVSEITNYGGADRSGRLRSNAFGGACLGSGRSGIPARWWVGKVLSSSEYGPGSIHSNHLCYLLLTYQLNMYQPRIQKTCGMLCLYMYSVQ